MKPAFWYWLFMTAWLVYGIILGYRRRAESTPLYWGIGWNIVLFILLVIIGYEIFPNPFDTLVAK
jgi:hypothetical protein